MAGQYTANEVARDLTLLEGGRSETARPRERHDEARIVDAHGAAVPGEAFDLPHAAQLAERLPGRVHLERADRGEEPRRPRAGGSFPGPRPLTPGLRLEPIAKVEDRVAATPPGEGSDAQMKIIRDP